MGMKIDRLIGILMMLINAKKVTARELAEHFEVSVRTIQRDLDTLTMAGVPLYADVGVHGGYQLHDSFRLDKGFLSKNEAGVLYAFLKELESHMPHAEVSSIYQKFSSLDAHDIKDSKLFVQVNPAHSASDLKKNLSVLSKARDEQRKVELTYLDVRFTITMRTFCPYSLVLIDSRWYSFGYCDLRSDFRMFKLGRIAECRLLNERFRVRDLPEELPWESGRDVGVREKIILEIDRNNQHILPDFIGPMNCRVENERIIVHLYFEVNEWLYTQLLAMAPYVKVIQPESLREGFVDLLMQSLKRNIDSTKLLKAGSEKK